MNGTLSQAGLCAATLREPKQERSRATLDRIVEATKELLETQRFDDISIAEIVRRARSSVGAFYVRFEDKAALLDYLDELYARQMVAAGEVAAQRASTATSLEEDVRGLITFLVHVHRLQPGLLRTLIIEARRQGEGAFRDRTRRMNRTIPAVMDRLLGRGIDRRSQSGRAERTGPTRSRGVRSFHRRVSSQRSCTKLTSPEPCSYW